MSIDDRRSQHEQAAQAALAASLDTAADDLAAAGLRAEVQAPYRDQAEGPFGSEVSVLLWDADNVVDCLVFSVWGRGQPVPIAEIKRMIDEELTEAIGKARRGRAHND